MDGTAKVIEHGGTGDLTVKLETALHATPHVQTRVQPK
jgi:hypothetical protein